MPDFFAYAFFCFGSLLIAGQWLSVLTLPFRPGRSVSLMPLVGGMIAAYGMANVSHESVQPWWWLPLVVDLGCAPMLALVTIGFAMGWWRERFGNAARK